MVCKPAPFEEDTDLPMSFPSPDGSRPRSPAHDGDLDWTEHVAKIVRTFGDYDAWAEFTTIQVTTWFVNHRTHRVCRRPRIIRLTSEVITWIDDLRTAWIDELDHSETFSIHVVRPTPPNFRQQGSRLHVMLEQARPEGSASVVLTALLEGFTDEGIIQGGFAVPVALDLDRVIDILDIRQFCQDRRCHVIYDHLQLPANIPFEVRTAASVRIRIEPSLGQSADDATQLPDIASINLVQTAIHLIGADATLIQASTGLRWQSRHSFEPSDSERLNPYAAVFTPGICAHLPFSPLVSDLQPRWHATALSREGEAHSAKILTWFLDHHSHWSVCQEPREVTLFENFHAWEALIKLAWNDHIGSDDAVSCHLVKPDPPSLESGVCAHVLLVMAPQINRVPVLVTILSHTSHIATLNRRAISAHDSIKIDQIASQVGFHEL